ncbi:MAG: energy transducer TonB [Reyranellales bacterium]
MTRVSHWALGGALAGSFALHALAGALALVALGSGGPIVDDSSAAITVFIEPNTAPVATASESKPTLEAALEPPPLEPPPPDFKSLPPPPPQPAQVTPHPPQPPPPRPKSTAARRSPSEPAQAAPSAPIATAPAAVASVAPSIVPGWNALLAVWLAAHRTYPDEARKRGEEGEVTIRFTVGGDGRVGEVALVKSSGWAALDSAALAMLRGAALPAPGTVATRTVRIRFRLND